MVMSYRDAVGAQLQGHRVFMGMGSVPKGIILLADLAATVITISNDKWVLMVQVPDDVYQTPGAASMSKYKTEEEQLIYREFTVLQTKCGLRGLFHGEVKVCHYGK